MTQEKVLGTGVCSISGRDLGPVERILALESNGGNSLASVTFSSLNSQILQRV